MTIETENQRLMAIASVPTMSEGLTFQGFGALRIQTIPLIFRNQSWEKRCNQYACFNVYIKMTILMQKMHIKWSFSSKMSEKPQEVQQTKKSGKFWYQTHLTRAQSPTEIVNISPLLSIVELYTFKRKVCPWISLTYRFQFLLQSLRNELVIV